MNESRQKEIEYLRGVEKTLVEDCELHVGFSIVAPEEEATEAENRVLKTRLEDAEKVAHGFYKEKELVMTRVRELENEVRRSREKCHMVSAAAPEKPQPDSSEMQEQLAAEREKRDEMRGEIEILISQCKEVHCHIKERDQQIKRQSIALQQFDTILQEKDAELLKREQHLGKMSKLLEEAKAQLQKANERTRQAGRQIVGEMSAKLLEKQRELRMLKELVKGHHAELQARDQDIAQMRKALDRRTDSEEEGKGRVKIPRLPTIPPTPHEGIEKSLTEDSGSQRPLRHRYPIPVRGLEPRQTHMRGILSQDYNVLQDSETHSKVADFLTPMRPRKKLDYDINIDVNEIIRKSIGGRSEKQRLRVGNLQSAVLSPTLRRLKLRKRSNQA